MLQCFGRIQRIQSYLCPFWCCFWLFSSVKLNWLGQVHTPQQRNSLPKHPKARWILSNADRNSWPPTPSIELKRIGLWLIQSNARKFPTFLDRTISIFGKWEDAFLLLEMMGVILWGCICWRYDVFFRARPVCFSQFKHSKSWKIWLIIQIWLLLRSNIASFYKYLKWRNALKYFAKWNVNHQNIMWI